MSELYNICFICLHQGLHDNISLETAVLSDAQNVNTITEFKYLLPELTILNPLYVCYWCRTTLHSYYLFKKRCLENYNRLIQTTKGIQGTSKTKKPEIQQQQEHEVYTRVHTRNDTRVDTRSDTRVDTRNDTRGDTRIDTWVDTRIDTRVDTRKDTRVDSLVDTRVDNHVDTRVDNRVDNTEDMRVDTPNDSRIDTPLLTEINIKEENSDSLFLSEEQDEQKTDIEDITIQEDYNISDDSLDLGIDEQGYQQRDYLKCEIVSISDNEQDGGFSNTSEDDNRLRDDSNFSHIDFSNEDTVSFFNVPDVKNPTVNLLPEKSKHVYEKAYNEFLLWCKSKKVKCYSENVLLAYFSQKSTCCTAATLGSYYSMVKATLIIHDNVDISKYPKLLAFLKDKNAHYKPKRSKKILSKEQVERFISQAPDDIYLMMKVAVIFGIAGSCTREELAQLKVDDIQNTGSSLLVTIRESAKTNRMFTIVANQEKSINFIELYRKYTALRQPQTHHQRLFVFYKHGKCSTQVVGINTFGRIPKEIATFLKLPDAKLYTGHCFRRSSASLLADAVAPAFSI